MNVSDLLKRAYSGGVAPAELSEVVRMIDSGQEEDLYTLVQILGRAGSPDYRGTVEKFLDNVGDPQLSALAVKVLCWSWGLAQDYRKHLLSFLEGVDWDVEDYVKLEAISAVGEYLQKNSDDEFLKAIYDIFTDEAGRPLVRGAAYRALCRSEGLEWKDIVPAPKVIDSSTLIDRSILERVERKLVGERNREV